MIHQINQSFCNQSKELYLSREAYDLNKDNEKISKLLTSESCAKNEFKGLKENSNKKDGDIKESDFLILNEIERPIEDNSILKNNNTHLDVVQINTSEFQIEDVENSLSNNDQENFMINPLFELR